MACHPRAFPHRALRIGQRRACCEHRRCRSVREPRELTGKSETGVPSTSDLRRTRYTISLPPIPQSFCILNSLYMITGSNNVSIILVYCFSPHPTLSSTSSLFFLGVAYLCTRRRNPVGNTSVPAGGSGQTRSTEGLGGSSRDTWVKCNPRRANQRDAIVRDRQLRPLTHPLGLFSNALQDSRNARRGKTRLGCRLKSAREKLRLKRAEELPPDFTVGVSTNTSLTKASSYGVG